MLRHFLSVLTLPLFCAASQAQAVMENAAGKWTKEMQVSELTGKTTLVWQIYSDNETRGSLQTMKPAQLIIACQENQTKVMFDFHDYMGPGDREVQYRLDKKPISSLTLGASEGGEAIGLWYGKGVKWLKALPGNKRLVVAAEAYNEPRVEAVFSLDGVEEVVATIGKACKW